MSNGPKIPLIQTPDHRFLGGARAQSLSASDAYGLLWVGRVLHVDTETMVCSIRIETGTGERHDIPIPAMGGGGPRSWSGTILEKGSKVLLGWKRYDHRNYVPYILQVLTVGTFPAREYEPFSTVDPADAAEALSLHPELEDDPRINLGVVRLKARKGYSGDFIASSSSGSDFILDRDVLLTNRAGNEIRLRDADQTMVSQSVNVFESTSAGQYRRGLIKRNAFNLLPDLYTSGQAVYGEVDGVPLSDFIKSKTPDVGPFLVDSVKPGSPAYEKLLQFGLVNASGKVTFPNDPSDPFYPFVVTPDGQRISYIVQGEHSQSFAETDQCYVEDRKEVFHTHDGVMDVTEEGDGVQVDSPSRVIIEDVLGTVVGNDPYTSAGRALYKRILTMRTFDSPDQGAPSAFPKLEPVDTITSQTEADTKALARLFRVQSPTSSNQYAFGITKEGRVFLHVPRSLTGTTEEKGKSVDANLVGMLKAVIGSDDNSRTSIDLTTTGGIKAVIGAFKDPDPERGDTISVDLVVKGKIRTTYESPTGRENIIGGNDLRTLSGSSLDVVGGASIENVGGSKAVEATGISHNAGFGGYKLKSAGDVNETVLGRTECNYAQDRKTTLALSDTKIMIAGVDSTTILAGQIARTVASGSGIADTVTTGNFSSTVVTGNMSMSVASGNLSATVGTGNLALSAGGGNASVNSGISTIVSAGAVAQVTAPVVKIGATVVGGVVAGVPGPPGPHIDFMTGLPIFGIPTVTIGP
jgi:hypothetical protein